MAEIYNTTEIYIEGEDLADFIVNYMPDTFAYSYRGDDQIVNYADGGFSVRGGAGHDTIINYAVSGSAILDGQWGNDLIVNYASNATEVSLGGGYGNDTLINCGSGMATLNATDVGDKVLIGGSGIDIFIVDIENNNTILGYDTNDWIVLDYNIYDVETSGDDVIIKDANAYELTIIKGAAGKQLNFFYDGFLAEDTNEENFKRMVANYEDMMTAANKSPGISGAVNISNTDVKTVYGGSFDDTIANYRAGKAAYTDTEIYGLGGNDSIANFANDVEIHGDTGNDIIENFTEYDADENFGDYFYGGWGNDTLINYFAPAVDFNGDYDDDLIINFASNDFVPDSRMELSGGKGNDTIINYGAGMATLYGDKSGLIFDDIENGDDVLIGSSSAVDVFKIDYKGGNDLIVNYDANDLINVGYDDYDVQIEGDDVVIYGVGYYGKHNGNSVRVLDGAHKQLNFFTEENKDDFNRAVEVYEDFRMALASEFYSLAAAVDTLNAEDYKFYATAYNDTIANEFDIADVYGLAGDDTLSNFAGNANVYGGTGNDLLEDFTEENYSGGHLYGGYGNDTLISHFSAQIYLSGDSDDDLIINYGFGTATLNGGDGDDLIINYASDPSMTGDRFYLDGGGYGNDTIINNSYGMATLDGANFYDSVTLIGGAGVDVFVVELNKGVNDVIMNYDVNDLIYVDLYSQPVIATVGADVVIFSDYDLQAEDYLSHVTIQGAADKILNLFTRDDKEAFEAAVASREEMLGTYEPTRSTGGGRILHGGDEDMVKADEFEIDDVSDRHTIVNVNDMDTINFTEETLSDIISTEIYSNAIDITFNTNEYTRVFTSDIISPTFKLASGESYVYNRETSEWQAV